MWQISAGRTHSAAWTCPAPVRRTHGATSALQLGTPSSVPAQYTSLQDCSIDDIKARLQLLHHYSDLVYSSWRLINLLPSHVSALHIHVIEPLGPSHVMEPLGPSYVSALYIHVIEPLGSVVVMILR